MKHSPRFAYERHPIAGARLAFDAAPSALARKPSAIASVPAKPSVSPKTAAPRKPTTDSPSRQENLQALLDFLAGALPYDLFAEVETALGQYVHGSQEPDSSYAPAADRRRRIAGDSASASDFSRRFPSARRIGFA